MSAAKTTHAKTVRPDARFCDETLLAMHVQFAAMHLSAAEACAAALHTAPEMRHPDVTPAEGTTINLCRALRALARFRYSEARAQAVIARLERKARR